MIDEELLGFAGQPPSSGSEAGDGGDSWRGEWPGERSMVAGKLGDAENMG